MRRLTLIAIALAIPSVSAQVRDSPVRVDVVSIKATKQPDARGISCGLPLVERSAGRLYIPFSQVCGLIRVAYNLADYQVAGIPRDGGVGPADFFEVDARLVGKDVPTVDDARAIVGRLLAERFRLRVRRESQDRSIYVLTVAKDGPRLRPCSDPKAPSGYAPGRIISCNPPIPMPRLLQFLSSETGQPVFDQTGLTEPTFELRWSPSLEEPQPDSPPVLYTAIQEQLGLKLEPQRGAIDILIVDSVEPPTAN